MAKEFFTNKIPDEHDYMPSSVTDKQLIMVRDSEIAPNDFGNENDNSSPRRYSSQLV